MTRKRSCRAFLQAWAWLAVVTLVAACTPTPVALPELPPGPTVTPAPTLVPTVTPAATLTPSATPRPAHTPAPAPVPLEAEVWLTTGDESQKLERQPNVQFLPGAGSPSLLRVQVQESATYQEIVGFGAALTDSAAWNMAGLGEGEREKLMRSLFARDGQGIGISYLRLPVGATDFTPDEPVTSFPIFYSYDDNDGQPDPDLSNFSISRDDADHYQRIAILAEALSLNPDLGLLASPWSAPGWMKDSGSPFGGQLLPQYYAAYANYFVKFIRAYEAEGLPIHAITVQNEPLHESDGYPSMRMGPSQQAEFIRDYLGPAFASAGIETQIVIYDHNWDRPQFALDVLADQGARAYIAGSAWHCYAGSPDALSQVQQVYPDKGIYQSECTGGEWDTAFPSVLGWNMHNLFIGAVRYGAQAVLLWNLALDDRHGPHTGGCADCRGVVTVGQDGAVQYEVEFYIIGHLAKFVRPGARRIACDDYPGRLETVGFRNPDGSIALVAYNPGAAAVDFGVEWGQANVQSFVYQLPPRSVATFAWGGAE